MPIAKCQLPSAKCCFSLPIRIPQISFGREIFSEAVQLDGLYPRGVTHALETHSGGKRHGTGSGKNLGRIVKENFIDDARGQRGSVDHGSAFDQKAGDFYGPEEARDFFHVGTAIPCADRNLLYANSLILQLALSLFFGKGAEYPHIF